MSTQITDEDMKHLQNFPADRRAEVMQKIMSLKPSKSVVLEGDDHFESTVLRLRRDGFGLIDLNPQESAFTTVWYRRGRALLGRAGAEVAMLLWEAQGRGGLITLVTWRV